MPGISGPTPENPLYVTMKARASGWEVGFSDNAGVASREGGCEMVAGGPVRSVLVHHSNAGGRERPVKFKREETHPHPRPLPFLAREKTRRPVHRRKDCHPVAPLLPHGHRNPPGRPVGRRHFR